MISNYSAPWGLDLNWESKPERSQTAFDKTAYKFTDLFLDSCLQNDMLPQDVADQLDLDDIDLFFQLMMENFGAILVQNGRVFTAFLFGLLIALLLPIFGISWCCVSNSLRAKSGPTKNHDRRTIWILGSIFMVLMLACWACLTWYIAAGIYSDVETDYFARRIQFAIDDTNRYFDNTGKHISHLSNQNYNEMSVRFSQAVAATSDQLEEDSATLIGDARLDQLLTLTVFSASAVSGYQDNKQSVTNANTDLSNAGMDLDAAVIAIQSDGDLNTILADNSVSTNFSDLANKRDSLNVDKTTLPNVDFGGISDSIIDSSVNSFTEVADSCIQGRNLLIAFPGQFTEFSKSLEDSMEEIGRIVSSEMEEYLAYINKLSLNDTDHVQDEIEEFMDDYGNYFFTTLMIPGMILFFIMVFMTLGLLFGCIGRSSSRTRRHGGNCVNAGLMLFFIFSLVFWLCCAGMFIWGAAAQKIWCETLEEPAEAQLAEVLSRELDEEIHQMLNDPRFGSVSWTLAGIVDSCSKNESVYNVLELKVIYDIEQLSNWPETTNLDANVDIVIQEMNNAIDLIVTSLGMTVTQTNIMRQAAGEINKLTDQVFMPVNDYNQDDTFNRADYDSFKAEMLELSQFISDNPSLGLDGNMAAVDQTMDSLEQSVVAFDAAVVTLKTAVQKFESEVVYNGQSFSQTVEQAIVLSTSFADYVNVDGRNMFLNTFSSSMNDEIEPAIDSYVQYVIVTVNEDLGSCKPMKNTYDGFINTTCYKVVDPFNWMWSGFGLLLLLFFPILILAVILADIFKRSEDFNDSGPRVVIIDATSRKESNASWTERLSKLKLSYYRMTKSIRHTANRVKLAIKNRRTSVDEIVKPI